MPRVAGRGPNLSGRGSLAVDRWPWSDCRGRIPPAQTPMASATDLGTVAALEVKREQWKLNADHLEVKLTRTKTGHLESRGPRTADQGPRIIRSGPSDIGSRSKGQRPKNVIFGPTGHGSGTAPRSMFLSNIHHENEMSINCLIKACKIAYNRDPWSVVRGP